MSYSSLPVVLSTVGCFIIDQTKAASYITARRRSRSDSLHRFTLCCFCGRGRDTTRSGDITLRLISDTSGGRHRLRTRGRPGRNRAVRGEHPRDKNKQHTKWHLVPTTACHKSNKTVLFGVFVRDAAAKIDFASTRSLLGTQSCDQR